MPSIRSATFRGAARGDLRGGGGVPFSAGEGELNCGFVVALATGAMGAAAGAAIVGTEIMVGNWARKAATSFGSSSSAVTAASATRFASVAMIFSRSASPTLLGPKRACTSLRARAKSRPEVERFSGSRSLSMQICRQSRTSSAQGDSAVAADLEVGAIKIREVDCRFCLRFADKWKE